MKTKLFSTAKVLMTLLAFVSIVGLWSGEAAADPKTCPGGVTVCTDPYAEQCKSKTDCNLVKKYVNPVIRFLTVLVGIAVTIGIIVGGIQYATSMGDMQKTIVAKNRIRQAIIALLVYIFLFALLRFLYPGGDLSY